MKVSLLLRMMAWAALTVAAVAAEPVAEAAPEPIPAARAIAPEENPAVAERLYTRRGSGPRQVILIVADGWGFQQLEAYRMWSGRAPLQAWPVQAAMSVFPAGGEYDAARFWKDPAYAHKHYTDSAASATAMATGVKTTNRSLAVDAQGQAVQTVLERAQALGKATGLVTSVQISHATTAAFGLHIADRNAYEAIARALLRQSELAVLMGAGHPHVDDSGARREPPDFRYVGGLDGWQTVEEHGWHLVETRADFQALAEGETPARVLGLAPVARTLQQMRSPAGKAAAAEPGGDPPIASVPTLAEMTAGALNVLDNDPDGFFLMIEAGAIDWAGHGNQMGRLLEEQAAMFAAVEVVERWVAEHSSWRETLVIVASDHETGGLAGPAAAESRGIWEPLEDRGVGELPGHVWLSGTHTTGLVPIFARGATAEELAKRFAVRNDPVLGPYLDNTDIAAHLFSQWPAQAPR